MTRNHRTKRLTLAAVLTLIVTALVVIGPAFLRDQKARRIVESMADWDASVCREIWHEAKAHAELADGTLQLSRDQLPKAVREAGFDGAEVSPESFRALYRTGAWMTAPPAVVCWFTGDENPEPELRYTGGRWFPDGRWERRPVAEPQ